MSCVHQATPEQWAELLAAIERGNQQLATEMPDDRAALLVMGRAHERLRKLGWRDACYCPKDGTVFEVIEAGSTGIHRAHYDGEWPNGTWWVHDDGDLWPSRPILFRLIPAARVSDEHPAGENPSGVEGEACQRDGEAGTPTPSLQPPTADVGLTDGEVS